MPGERRRWFAERGAIDAPSGVLESQGRNVTEPVSRTVRLDPPGVDVHVERMGGAWSFVTEGLRAANHPELALSLVVAAEDRDDGLLPQPLELLATLSTRALGGATTSPGDWTELGPVGLFGRSELGGLTYVPLPGQLHDHEVLLVVPLTRTELELVRTVGPMRIVARLGEAAETYPYPASTDRARPNVAGAGEVQQTLLAQTPTLLVPGSHCTKIEECIEVELARSDRALLQRVADAPDDAAVALLTFPSPSATALLVWHVGQPNPRAYAAPGASLDRLGGHFCLLVSEQEEDGGQLLEDGFAMSLTPTSWGRVRRALAGGDDITVESRDGLGLALRWV